MTLLGKWSLKNTLENWVMRKTETERTGSESCYKGDFSISSIKKPSDSTTRASE